MPLVKPSPQTINKYSCNINPRESQWSSRTSKSLLAHIGPRWIIHATGECSYYQPVLQPSLSIPGECHAGGCKGRISAEKNSRRGLPNTVTNIPNPGPGDDTIPYSSKSFRILFTLRSGQCMVFAKLYAWRRDGYLAAINPQSGGCV